MTAKIRIRQAEGTWVVRAGGAVIAESKKAKELSEDGYEDVIYFPREDVGMVLLDNSNHTSHCPHKGDASYFDIVTKSTTIKDAAWSYASAKEDVAEIDGHIAFYNRDQVTVEQL